MDRIPFHAVPLPIVKLLGVGYSLVFLRQDKALALNSSDLQILSD